MTDYERVWRAFEANEISHSGAHYLLAVASFLKVGQAPRAVDISRQLNVSRAAVSLQIRNLKAHNLVEVDAGHRIQLTREGADLVARIAGKRGVVKVFLQEVLGVEERTAERDACKVEHLISEETCAALVRLISFLRSNHPAAKACLESFREIVASCDPLSRCDLCTEDCLLSTLGVIEPQDEPPAGLQEN